MDDFDKLRWKMADQLTPDEAQIIVENQDKLNAEELAAFSELIAQAQPLPDNPLEDQIEKVGEKPEEPVIPTTPVTPVVPETPTIPDNVITSDNLDAYMEEKRKQWEAEGKTKAEQAKETEEIKFELFKGTIPDDWDQAVNKFAPAIIDAAEKRILAKLDAQNSEFMQNQAKLKASQEEVYKRFESEFQTLAKNKLIPDPKENPDEYKKIHDAIIKVGDENGKSNVTDAYKLWSIIPEEHGGGFKTGNQQAQQKANMEAQKEAAGKIGSGRGAPGSAKKGAPSWASIHNTRMEDLIDSRLHEA